MFFFQLIKLCVKTTPEMDTNYSLKFNWNQQTKPKLHLLFAIIFQMCALRKASLSLRLSPLARLEVHQLWLWTWHRVSHPQCCSCMLLWFLTVLTYFLKNNEIILWSVFWSFSLTMSVVWDTSEKQTNEHLIDLDAACCYAADARHIRPNRPFQSIQSYPNIRRSINISKVYNLDKYHVSNRETQHAYWSVTSY